jgi:hypothetical protein
MGWGVLLHPEQQYSDTHQCLQGSALVMLLLQQLGGGSCRGCLETYQHYNSSAARFADSKPLQTQHSSSQRQCSST